MDISAERVETVIVGGGQAGLAVGYHLARRGRPFVILDGSERIGDPWRRRWTSLRLFSPARYDGLPGWRFPAPAWSFPTKDEMADYLEAYAARFDLPVRTGVWVESVARDGGRFVVVAGERRLEADHVVVASGAHRIPRVPELAGGLEPGILQLHSSEYGDPSQLREGPVLVVGAGNSGAEIAFELARTRSTWLSGRVVGEIPVRHGSRRGRVFLPLIRFIGHRVLTVRTPIGRRVGPTLARGATPLIRVKSTDLTAAGVERVPRVVGTRDGLPVLEGDRVLEPASIIWATGFRQDFSWIDLPVHGDDGQPIHDRGIARSEPGLAFVGLPFQYAATSDVLPGVGRDARRVARHIAGLARAAGRSPGHAHADPDAARAPAASGAV
jgi:putative flavoprotein involved in K+ transport